MATKIIGSHVNEVGTVADQFNRDVSGRASWPTSLRQAMARTIGRYRRRIREFGRLPRREYPFSETSSLVSSRKHKVYCLW